MDFTTFPLSWFMGNYINIHDFLSWNYSPWSLSPYLSLHHLQSYLGSWSAPFIFHLLSNRRLVGSNFMPPVSKFWHFFWWWTPFWVIILLWWWYLSSPKCLSKWNKRNISGVAFPWRRWYILWFYVQPLLSGPLLWLRPLGGSVQLVWFLITYKSHSLHRLCLSFFSCPFRI